MRTMPPITGRSRQEGVLDAFAAHMQKTRKQGAHVHSPRAGVVNASNYYAGYHKANGVLVTVTRSGRTKPLDPCYDLRNNSPSGFAWGYNGNGPAQLALAMLTDYFGANPGGKALAEALYEPFKCSVIVALPECWKMNFEEVGIALCRTLTEKPDLLDRVISSLESAVLDEIVRHQKRDELFDPANLSESIAAAITEMLSEAFSMSRAFAGSLVERHYTGLYAPA
jgi:hypothetical protein